MSHSDKNQKASGIILIVIGALLVIGSLIFYLNGKNKSAIAQSLGMPSAPIAHSDISAPNAANSAADSTAIDVKAALAPRTLGSADAPVKIFEYSSLSCGHCAKFHHEILPKLKKRYIDTGEVELIFNEFPLNLQALDGTMIARCLPADQYIPFTTILFEKMADWAYKEDYKEKLQALAAKAGMSQARFDACLASDKLRQAILGNMQAAAQQWKVSATPSFLVNNKTLITGARGMDAFVEAIDQAKAAIAEGAVTQPEQAEASTDENQPENAE